ncbi:DegT/DnrJ/EryC1/StrS family aminotransferase [Streptomyces sp. KPB2]|uniref:DegT/DnrJ/EryC1/StrS family aminotransferase n=1 Tax=Streptomyces sp. KPB2 TaxID=2305221 RepID=UPI001F496686|nr:DegT/DnrJ/EryC1/StrS family aminotransferase [Streptomyces sp. KPB2]
MTVHVWDYLPEYEAEREDLLDAVDTVFRSGRLILGDAVSGFETEFAAYHGLAHCTGVDNGTNAVKLGLEALGVGPGDEVITVSNTAAPTVVAIDGAGATPVFVDVREDDFLMDTDQVAAAVTPRTRALLPVHLYGQCVDMAPLRELARRHDLVILEDCAQAHGARHHGRLAGTMGDAAAFSFYPTKVLGAYGDAGAVLTDSAETDARLRRLRYYGMAERYYVVQTPGHNSRLDEVQAEIKPGDQVRVLARTGHQHLVSGAAGRPGQGNAGVDGRGSATGDEQESHGSSSRGSPDRRPRQDPRPRPVY